MMLDIVKALALNEARLRMRRTSTLVVLLAVVAISWAMIADPATGSALIVVKDARVLYSSSALSIGSASLACILFGLGGFYLVRGRISEDIRSGTGSVIGATPVGNALFVFSRWLGSVTYLATMIFAFMLTIMVLHAVRGEGPIEPLIYLQNYVLILLPMVLFTASFAMLFDSWAPLMGKGGDVLFFVVWMAQLAVMPIIESSKGALPLLELLDFSGIGASMVVVTGALGSSQVALGGGDFNAALAPVKLANALWSARLAGMRGVTGLLALLPLLLSVCVFHRFSPDKVKVSRAGKRRTPLELINGWLKPLSALAAPLFRLSARVGGFSGQVLGDVAFTFAAAPLAIVALAASVIAALVAGQTALAPVVMASVLYWGVLVSDVSTRDYAADTEHMSATMHGGATLRYLRQYAATVMMGLMFTGVPALRWALTDPRRALALVVGVASMAALASMFGRTARSARLFLSLFLFWFYIALNAGRVPRLDAVGFLGVADAQSILTWMVAGAIALAGGYWWNRRAV